MKNKIYILFISLFALMFSGCISEYTPHDIENTSGILVVEGVISEGEFIIKLTTSVGIESELSFGPAITNAAVNVECNDGATYQPKELSAEGYTFFIEKLDKEKEYRLNITYNGNNYQSTFLKPEITPDIDEVYYKKEAKKSPVKLYVSTHDDDIDGSSYYIWSFLEEWEYHAQYVANTRIIWVNGEQEVIEYDDPDTSPNNIYYCWARNQSKNFILGSSSGLTSNVIEDMYLTEAEPTNRRWQTLYRITVKQNAIRKEAYDYFSNMRKNVEESGSIFAPIPSEMNGNITCLTDPTLPVIGYIDVSTTKTKVIYITHEDVYEPYRSDCEIAYDAEEAAELAFELYYKGDFGAVLYSSRDCFDCTVLGGSKNRPDNWPTENH